MDRRPYVMEAVGKVLAGIPQAGPWLQQRYLQLWNPANYALVGGIGVLINYAVWGLLVSVAPGLPWFITNFLAILCAWSWNWGNSVGPLGWLWGFHRPEKEGVQHAKNKRNRARAK